MERCLGYFFRFAKSLHGMAVPGRFTHRFGVDVTCEAAPQHRRVDGSRRDRIDADSVGGEIDRHGPAQADNRAFGSYIGTVTLAAGDRELRSEGND